MFAAARATIRLTALVTLFATCASLVLALGITAITVSEVVTQAVANVLVADPCAGRTMLIDQCASLDTSHITDLRPQAAERNPG